MEAHLVRWQAVNLTLSRGEVLEDRHRLLFHPIGEPAFSDQLPDLGEGAARFMRMGVTMRVCMVVGVRLAPVVMLAGHMHIELHPFEARPASTRDVQVVT